MSSEVICLDATSLGGMTTSSLFSNCRNVKYLSLSEKTIDTPLKVY